MPVDTKNLIADAFLQLTLQKKIDKITIKDVVESCKISRQAFYYHFQDILDVLEWVVRRNMQQAFEDTLQYDDPREAMRSMIQSIIDNHERINRLLSSQHSEQIQQILMQTFCSLLKEVRLKKHLRLTAPTQDSETTLRFLAYGISGVLREAIRDGNLDAGFLCDELFALTSKVFETSP